MFSWRQASVWFDTRELDYLGPLLGLVSDELAEVGGRPDKHRCAEIGKPRFQFGIGEAGIDIRIELLDYLGGCVLRRTDADPGARLIARHELAYRWDVRQHVRTCGCGHRERAQLAGLEVLERLC